MIINHSSSLMDRISDLEPIFCDVEGIEVLLFLIKLMASESCFLKKDKKKMFLCWQNKLKIWQYVVFSNLLMAASKTARKHSNFFKYFGWLVLSLKENILLLFFYTSNDSKYLTLMRCPRNQWSLQLHLTCGKRRDQSPVYPWFLVRA